MMKLLLCLLVSILLLCSCAFNGDSKIYEKALAEQESYNKALRDAVRTVPEFRQKNASLSRSHRAMLAARGQEMSPEEHQKLVRAKAAGLTPTDLPKRPAELDHQRLNEEQARRLVGEAQKTDEMETVLPVILECHQDRQWLESEISRLRAEPIKQWSIHRVYDQGADGGSVRTDLWVGSDGLVVHEETLSGSIGPRQTRRAESKASPEQLARLEQMIQKLDLSAGSQDPPGGQYRITVTTDGYDRNFESMRKVFDEPAAPLAIALLEVSPWR